MADFDVCSEKIGNVKDTRMYYWERAGEYYLYRIPHHDGNYYYPVVEGAVSAMTVDYPAANPMDLTQAREYYRSIGWIEVTKERWHALLVMR